jgi:MFS superfamily sulfate permease-like transporter
MTGLVAAAGLALTLIFLTKPLGGLPMAVLSAVLIKSALGLFDLRALDVLRRVSPREFRLCLLTLLGVVTVGVLPGVIVAVIAALGQLLVRASQPHDAVLGRIPGTNDYGDTTKYAGAESVPGLVIYRFDAALVFFNADHFKARVRSIVRNAAAPVRAFVLDAESMPHLDTTGAAVLNELRSDLERAGIAFAVAAAKNPIRTMLERTGFAERAGSGRMFPSVHAAAETLSATGT